MLIEREDVLESLAALVDDAAAGAGRLVFLGGEAGLGKTSLCAALAQVASPRLKTRRGGCDNVATAAALGPLFDAVPELTDVIGEDAEPNRARLFRRVRAVLVAEPTLLVLEDLHWSDETTLDLLRYLGRRLVDVSLLVLVTFREDEVVGSHPLAVVRGDLATSPGVTWMSLKPLTAAGVAELLAASGSVLDSDAVHRSTGGNPFYVTEVLAAGTDRLPATVRDAVLARATRLSPAAQQILAAAAVLGQRADLRLLVEVSGQDAAAVDECVQRGMLVGEERGWGFRHELARLAIEQTLSPTARTRLHAAALTALRAVGELDHRRLAHHAAGCGDREAVLVHAPLAAAGAARLRAHREAVVQYRLALEFQDRDADGRAGLFSALSYECYLTDQLDDAREARLQALNLYERAGDALAIGTAQRWLSRLSWFLGRNDEAEQYGARAVTTLEAAGASHELAMAYSNLSQLGMLAGATAGAVSWGTRAIELARRIDDRDTEIHALNNVGTALADGGDELGGLRRLAQSLDLALAADAHEHAARAYTNLGTASVGNRRFADAERHLRAGIGYCTDRDLDSWRLYMTGWSAKLLAEQGRYVEAQKCVTDVLRHLHLSPITLMSTCVVAGQLAVRRGGDGAEYFAPALALAESTGEGQRLVPAAAALAEAAWISGDVDALVMQIDRAWTVAVEHPNRWDLGELSWWLLLGGVRRDLPVSPAEPFALMLAGDWRDAADAWQGIGAPLWSAYALSASPELADAREALEIVDSLGASGVRRAMLADRRRRGLPMPRGPRATSSANPAGLTSRELDVLRLLAGGLSNADVAAQLFLSEKTVGHHVSALLRKLGQPTRSRAVAAALRRGIVAPM